VAVFALSDRQRVLGVLPWLEQHHPHMHDANPEVALRAFYAHGRIKVGRVRRVAFLVAAAADRSRWRRAARGKPCAADGGGVVRLKYLTEHFLAVRHCRRDPCPLRPRHPDLTRLFEGNGSAATDDVAQRRVLGALELDRGFIDGQRWGPAWDLVESDRPARDAYAAPGTSG
jgi:hypothetical protein